jgi:hypothetical protein
MAKFINKKEQVFDLQLTTYGRRMFSVGSFRPTYYTFFDDNVVYDSRYISLTGSAQNSINERVKDDTQYLESLTLFEDLETTVLQNRGGVIDFFDKNDMATKFEPAKDIYKLDDAIGDAQLDASSQTAPAWKMVALQGNVTSSTTQDTTNETNIPQINIDANYVLRVMDREYMFDPDSSRDLLGFTRAFIDGNVIALETDDPLIYIEEINTQILNDNFELEVFVQPVGDASRLERKYFKKEVPQIKDGLMLSPVQINLSGESEQDNTSSVEYYFDVIADSQVDRAIACKGAEIFNKQSYYVDLDFDCQVEDEDNVYFDIYGAVTEPEICQ